MSPMSKTAEATSSLLSVPFLRASDTVADSRPFSLTDEQERVQKKTFVNWINSYLSKVSGCRDEINNSVTCLRFNGFARELTDG